jgi:hypothetical protein
MTLQIELIAPLVLHIRCDEQTRQRNRNQPQNNPR